MKKERFEPYKEKLIAILLKKDIYFSENDGLDNVLFYSKKHNKAIRHQEFYRHSGIYSYKVDTTGTFFKLEPMSDEMFYLGWMRSIVEYSFKDK